MPRIRHLLFAALGLVLVCVALGTAPAPADGSPACLQSCNGTLVALPSFAGVGHKWMNLMLAVVSAERYSATLELSQNFFAPAKAHSDSNYSWTNKFLSIPYASSDKEKRATTVYSLIQLAKIFSCAKNMTYKADFGGRFTNACARQRYPTFASFIYKGLYNQASSIIEAKYHVAMPDSDEVLQQYGYDDDPIFVHWHVRTGDICLILDASLFLFVKDTIDKNIKNRRVVHHVFTLNKTQGYSHIARMTKNETSMKLFREHFVLIDKHDMEHVVEQLAAAHILVSLGSSSNYIVPTLKNHANFIHLYFPPKECLQKPNGAFFALKSFAEMEYARNNPAYSAYFVNTGVVPVFNIGKKNFISKDYHNKLETMLGYLDRREAIPRNISELTYESWTTHGHPSMYCHDFAPLSSGANSSLSLCRNQTKFVGSII